MARLQIIVSGKGLRRESVHKLVEAALVAKYDTENVSVSTTDATIPGSRAERFAAAIGDVGGAKNEMESLRDELQGWLDNLPESFQQGNKGDELQSAIDELEDIVSTLEDVEGRDVAFPGMY
jgi:hypothetical protein